MAKRLSYPLTLVGFLVNFWLKASDMLWAGSVLSRRTDWRTFDNNEAKLELNSVEKESLVWWTIEYRSNLHVVFPTPPLPPTKIHFRVFLSTRLFRLFRSVCEETKAEVEWIWDINVENLQGKTMRRRSIASCQLEWFLLFVSSKSKNEERIAQAQKVNSLYWSNDVEEKMSLADSRRPATKKKIKSIKPELNVDSNVKNNCRLVRSRFGRKAEVKQTKWCRSMRKIINENEQKKENKTKRLSNERNRSQWKRSSLEGRFVGATNFCSF